jgi:hypothetical protein
MPLLDHFHPPLSEQRHWESFHSLWAGEILALLNQGVLPPGYFAETQVHVGPYVEVDVASFEPESGGAPAGTGNGSVAVASLTEAVIQTMPAIFPDEFEVQVFRSSGGATLVGAIELVSPRNKDRPNARRAFAIKCGSYLHRGIGLVVVDVVTDRLANLHDELIDVLGQAPAYRFPGNANQYTVAYRSLRTRANEEQIELRFVPLGVGRPLPIVPLALLGGPTVPIDLETSYTAARQRSRL